MPSNQNWLKSKNGPATYMKYFKISVSEDPVLSETCTSKMVYPQKDRNGIRPQWKKTMRIKTTVYSKTARPILVIRLH